jgi:ATP-binding cassette, subfamily B, bacterial
MVKYVLRYYSKVTWSFRKYSIPPLILAPFARIGSEYVTPLIAASILDKITSTDRPRLGSFTGLIILYALVPFTAELLWRLIKWQLQHAEVNALESIAQDTFKRIMNKGYEFHTNNFAGALVAKTNRFINAYEDLYDVLVFNIVGTLIPFIFAIVVLIKLSRPVGLVFSAVVAVFIYIVFKLTRQRMKLNTLRAEAESVQTGVLADALSNALTIKSFAHEKYESKIYSKALLDLKKKRFSAWQYQNIPMDLVVTSTTIALNTVALSGGLIATYRYGMKTGTVYIMITYVLRLTARLWDFSNIMRNIEKNLSDAVEMAMILDGKDEVEDLKNSKDLVVAVGSIKFKDVSFSYNQKRESHLFRHLNLEIKPGQKIGLVGPSGGGKTTITKLLLRFMDILEGDILIDSQKISDVSQLSLRRAITYVPQEPLLFHRSILENIEYGKPGASKKEVIEAAKKANAHEFIKSLPNSYDTLVGERGIKLSGGQRQRVAIARAILKNSPIIVLDEATSALDSESEALIQDALFKLMEGKTTIVIAHRLSTIKHLDRIIVLEDGKITEDGSHDVLISQKGTYSRLWSHQSGGFIED